MHKIPSHVTLKEVARIALTAMVMGCSAGAQTVCWGQTTDSAESYPSRPIRIVVPFPPGVGNDLTARLVAEKLTEAWGQQVIVENRSGAGGRIGTDVGAKAMPDGYTLTLATSGAMGIAPALHSKLPYDVLRDFAPITTVATQAQVLIASTGTSVGTVADAVGLARSRPGIVNYASIGSGSLTHVSMEMLQSFANIKLAHIPFNGSGPAQIGLMGGQVQLMFDSLPAALPLIRSGKVRGIAVTSLERQALAPELPTIAESGYPGFEALGWGGVVAPAKTPVPILDKLNQEIVRIVNLPDVRGRFHALGFSTKAGTRAQQAEFLRSEIDKWRKVIKDAGLKLEN